MAASTTCAALALLCLALCGTAHAQFFNDIYDRPQRNTFYGFGFPLMGFGLGGLGGLGLLGGNAALSNANAVTLFGPAGSNSAVSASGAGCKGTPSLSSNSSSSSIQRGYIRLSKTHHIHSLAAP